MNNRTFVYTVFLGIGVTLFLRVIGEERASKRFPGQVAFESQPRWDDDLNFEKIEYHLVHDEIIASCSIADYLTQVGMICDFDNEVHLVTLKSGLKAVFKPGEERFGEVAAYRASAMLGCRLVPPTVLRICNKKEGSLQFFVEPSVDPLTLENPESSFQGLDEKTIHDMRLFYFVFGQWDINPSNQVLQINKGKKYIALIDNAGLCNQSKAQYGDFAFVRRAYSDTRNDTFDTPFPFENPMTLDTPTHEEMVQAFKGFLSHEVLLRMWSRYKHITYAIWRNSLWIQYYKHNTEMKPNYIDHYYQSTLRAYEKLNTSMLEEIWREALEYNRNYYKTLITLTLERKEMVLRAAQQSVLDANAPR